MKRGKLFLRDVALSSDGKQVICDFATRLRERKKLEERPNRAIQQLEQE
jgi:hypothetical protein